MKNPFRPLQVAATHFVLMAYTALALFPVLLVAVNSFKDKLVIFSSPYSLPNGKTFTLVGYQTLAEGAHFDRYFLNSLVVALGSIFLILFVSSLASFALSEYTFKLNTFLSLFLAVGIMVPIRLGTVGILELAKQLHLIDTLWILILVYTAQGIPLAVFVLTQFMRQVPRDLKDAARIDGAGEYRIYSLILPLVRPALGTVAAISMIPIWNDLWFPLILASSDKSKTIVLGAQVFLGQFVNDYNAVLAALTLAMLPAVLLYLIFSQQLIRGLTSGAIR
ncbi:MAG: carbohydrate ABC transporter permease [Deinococcus sp.]|nr:carbohydrate ABC transporter permease [Deinococcus sp.]MCL5964886.1 carbohydrate ABC transporter permease [Deinococcus sp.]